MQNSKNYNEHIIHKGFGINLLPKIVKDIVLPLLKNYSIIALTGPLGAGKTTLVQEILKQLGVQEPITSPTFGYLKNYLLPDHRTIHHFDLYRIDSLEGFIASGFDEYLHKKNALTFIEWPAIINPLLKKQKPLFITLEFDANDSSMRIITIVS